MPVTTEISTSRSTPHQSWNHSLPLTPPNLDAWISLHKATEFVAQEFSRSGVRALQRQASDMKLCGSRLIYRKTTDESGEETLILSRWWTCGSPGCPICQLWKWSEWDLRLQYAFPRLEERHAHARWLSLVFPYPPIPVSELRVEIDRMNRGLDRLRQRKIWPGSGLVKMIRVEILPGGLCQIEIHLLVMVCACHSRTLEIPSPEHWASLWTTSVKADTPLDVICRTVPPGDPETTLAGLRQALDTALLPTYCSDGPVLCEKALQLKGKRLVSALGEVAGPLREAQARIGRPGWVRSSDRYRPGRDEISVRLTGCDCDPEQALRLAARHDSDEGVIYGGRGSFLSKNRNHL